MFDGATFPEMISRIEFVTVSATEFRKSIAVAETDTGWMERTP
jgi:hypothetical protein